MPAECAIIIGVPVLKGKGDIVNCSLYVVDMLFEHGVKVD